MPDLAGRRVLIAGATSASGLAAARGLSAAGARVIAVGRDERRLAELARAAGPRVRTEVADLGDEAAVADLVIRVHAHGPVDGILHLVGGWRGGGGLAGQTEDDYRFLEGSLTALRHVSRAFDADLRTSDAARQAIVSSTAVADPSAGGANYVAVKAASETWLRAVAQGQRLAARNAAAPLRAASVIFRVKALAGLEDVLARSFAELWDADAAAVNGTVVTLAADTAR